MITTLIDPLIIECHRWSVTDWLACREHARVYNYISQQGPVTITCRSSRIHIARVSSDPACFHYVIIRYNVTSINIALQVGWNRCVDFEWNEMLFKCTTLCWLQLSRESTRQVNVTPCSAKDCCFYFNRLVFTTRLHYLHVLEMNWRALILMRCGYSPSSD